MCGIAGSINKPLDVGGLATDLHHRGPDFQSSFTTNRIELHHFRLAIVDIACGNQPMSYGDLTIIFNGEIYNHEELRVRHRLSCNTGSDTETLLHLFAMFREKALDELDGMFAFAIYDRIKDELFIARDRAGKKPLYYYSDGPRFVFASELNALRRQVNPGIRTDSIRQYLRMGYFYQSNTPYEKVYEFPAGTYAKVQIDSGSVQLTKWWDIHRFYLNPSKDDFRSALKKTEDFIHTAVQRRVESSDLEVGSFLSGGIDSGIVTAIAKQYNSRLKTFTVSFAGEYNEAPLAKLVADKYSTDHYEIKIDFDNLEQNIENILSNYGEPFFDSSAIPSYYVAKAAREFLTVILNGDGGDELFGGYRRYVPFSKYDFFKPRAITKATASFLHRMLPMPHEKKSNYTFLYRLVDLFRKNGLEAYLSATIDSFEGYENYLGPESSGLAQVEKDFQRINRSGLSGLKKIMNLDFDSILAGDLLVKMDIATMANSLEGRSPLLSKELLEYIPTLPDDYRIKGSTTKYLLRTLAKKYLPEQLIYQPKRGFEIPLKKWIGGQLRNIVADYILSPDAYILNYTSADFIHKMWEKRIPISDEKRAKIIWTIFALEVWHKKSFNLNA